MQSTPIWLLRLLLALPVLPLIGAAGGTEAPRKTRRRKPEGPPKEPPKEDDPPADPPKDPPEDPPEDPRPIRRRNRPKRLIHRPTRPRILQKILRQTRPLIRPPRTSAGSRPT